MSGPWLIVLVAVLVTLTVIGFGLGAGQPRLPGDELPEIPSWVRDLGARFDDSRPLRPSEVIGCTLRARMLDLPEDGRVRCEIEEADERTREVRLRIRRGRADITARLRGSPRAEVEVTLPDESDDNNVREGRLRIPREGASLTVECKRGPCQLEFARP